jgi:hypothetical protein
MMVRDESAPTGAYRRISCVTVSLPYQHNHCCSIITSAVTCKKTAVACLLHRNDLDERTVRVGYHFFLFPVDGTVYLPIVKAHSSAPVPRMQRVLPVALAVEFGVTDSCLRNGRDASAAHIAVKGTRGNMDVQWAGDEADT